MTVMQSTPAIKEIRFLPRGDFLNLSSVEEWRDTSKTEEEAKEIILSSFWLGIIIFNLGSEKVK